MRISTLALFLLANLGVGAVASAQAAATVCKDGTPSNATGRGACTAHGGVDKAATDKADKAVKAATKAEVKEANAAGAQVSCADGSTSNSGRGACSHHGGVQLKGMASTPATARPAPVAVPATSTPTRAQPSRPAPTPAAVPAAPTTASVPAPAPPSSSRPTPTTAAKPVLPSTRRGEDNDPTGAIAQCKDGMYSHAANRRGACSRHKGVAKWLG